MLLLRQAFFVVILHVASSLLSQGTLSPPFWGPYWTAPFFQTITIDYFFTFNNSVQWFYDSSTSPVGSSLYRHSKGQIDELCTSIVGKEKSDEACDLLASVDGWRRIIFPSSGECCKYCNTSDYCGIVSPDWLQKNSTFVGSLTIGGKVCDGWLKEGGEKNFYYAERNSGQPCEYYEGYPTLPQSSNYWHFSDYYTDFSRSRPAPSTFTPPANCDSMCEISESSYAERVAYRVQHYRG